ncbi:GNAT family N-acetyltransferase [Dyadobacter pollutisoli]|uniref:GNAT family protein n=1 Tax=Dyadobacter pollutisoli TaxID=2910158 RepID=A0A9E8SPF3_9BACT|nr:GNAT family protein [Dyadobacter pollutisoli]WAC14671.1 GNAT family protein [Dyadobacter pollutisoli]
MISVEVKIETPRLLIREYQAGDLSSIHEYASQPSVVRYETWGPNAYHDTEGFLRDAQNSRNEQPRVTFELGIERKEDGRQIGGCELDISSLDGCAAIMGYIINPLFWNNGYATEVAKALLNYGFEEHNLVVIRGTCDSKNLASQRVLEKSGFILEKVIRHHFVQKGVLRDTCQYMMVRSRYMQYKKEGQGLS